MSNRLISWTYNFIRFAFWLLAIAGTIIVIVGLVNLVIPESNRGGKVSFPLGFSIEQNGTFTSPSGTHPVEFGKTTSEVTIGNPPNLILILMLFNVIINFLPVLYIIHLLKTIFLSLKLGTPFTRTNSLYIQKIGITIILISFISPIMSALNYLLCWDRLQAAGLSPELRLSLPTGLIFTGILLIILSQVFAYGTTISEERDLTI